MLGYGSFELMPQDPLIGRTIAQYRIDARLGGGGMGVVYLARDTKLEREVALKFLPPQWCHDDGAKQRFLREAQAASATNHRNICTIHDIEQTDDGQLFIVMARYEGLTLKEKLDHGPLELTEALDIAAEIAEGLSRAHAQGVVHRDIKPGNIMVTEDGIRILDFGLAKLADAALKLTMEGSTLGTVAYMAPEQARGEEADERSDIWALGVVLYEMIAGELPFKGAYPEAIFYAIKNEEPVPLAAEAPGVPEAVEQIVRRALAKNPEDRYQNAREVAREIRLLQGRSLPLELRTEPVQVLHARGQTPEDRATQHRVRRRRSRTRIGIAATILTAVAAGGYAWLARPLPRTAIAIVPVANHTGETELDPYRLALTQALIAELAGSPNLRVAPYARLLEAVRGYLERGEDPASRQAMGDIAQRTSAQLVVLPTIEARDGVWMGRADVRNAARGTSLATIETEPVTSSLLKETAQRLVVSLAAQIQREFAVRWPHRAEPRGAGARFRSLDAARAFESGVNAYEQLEYADALAAFRRAVELDPQRAIARAWVSRTALLMGDMRASETAAQAAVSSVSAETPESDALFASAVLAEAQNDYSTAEARYRQLAERHRDDGTGQSELAGFLKRRARNEQAIDAYHETLRRDPDVVSAHVQLCQLYSAVDDYRLSEQHAQTALLKFRAWGNRGGAAHAQLCYGDALLQQGIRIAEARTFIEDARATFEALQQRYSLARTYQYLGYLAARQRNYPAAIEAFEQALARSRDIGNRQLEGLELMNLGLAQARMGRAHDAIAFFQLSRDVYQQIGDERRAAEEEVLAAGLQVDYGSGVSEGLRRLSAARGTLRKLGHTDFEVLAMQVEAVHLRDTGKIEDALKVLHQAITLANERHLADRVHTLNLEIGISHFAKGDFDAARKVLEKTIEDGTPEARIVLGRVNLRLGELSAAKVHLERALGEVHATGELELMPQLRLALGELAYSEGRLAEARGHFSKAADSWSAGLAIPASVEARCYSGLLERRPALITTAIDQSIELGRKALEEHCRRLLAKMGDSGTGSKLFE